MSRYMTAKHTWMVAEAAEILQAVDEKGLNSLEDGDFAPLDLGV